jgi:hypothetical protein
MLTISLHFGYTDFTAASTIDTVGRRLSLDRLVRKKPPAAVYFDNKLGYINRHLCIHAESSLEEKMVESTVSHVRKQFLPAMASLTSVILHFVP